MLGTRVRHDLVMVWVVWAGRLMQQPPGVRCLVVAAMAQAAEAALED
jgi:hypothetical protein